MPRPGISITASGSRNGLLCQARPASLNQNPVSIRLGFTTRM